MFFFSSGAYSTPVCPADPAKSFSCLNIHLKLLIHSDTQTVHSLVLDWFSKIYNPQRMNRDCVSPIGDAVFCWCLKVEKSYAGYCAPGAFLHSQTTLTRKNTQNIYFLPPIRHGMSIKLSLANLANVSKIYDRWLGG